MIKLFNFSPRRFLMLAILISGCSGNEAEERKMAAWVWSQVVVESQQNVPIIFPSLRDASVLASDDSVYIIDAVVKLRERPAAYHCEIKYMGGDVDSPASWDIHSCHLK